ncbi:MAG: hypothetical protein ACODTL_19965 [Brucella sp.]|uniref:hypothetical protein n=1 Tax=Brucella tritici TaxID=94626 RepID=UPI00142ECE3D|nr:hypothetical protein [Brucella tritici]
MTAAAIQGTNIAKAARSQQPGAIGTAYPVAVVDTHTDGNRMTLAESGDRLCNGSNRKDGSECKNSGDRMQFHVPLQVTMNHNPQAEPVHQSLERRPRQTPRRKSETVREMPLKSVLRAPHLTQSGQKAHQITNVSMPRPELAQHHYLIITKQQIGLLAKLASQVF